MRHVSSSLCILLVVVGGFLCIVGPLNGFGTDTLAARVVVTASGVGLILFGVSSLYLLNGRTWSKVIDEVAALIFWGW